MGVERCGSFEEASKIMNAFIRKRIWGVSLRRLQQVLWLLLATPLLTYAQGVCIPPTVTVKQVRGQVFFGYDGKRRPQEGVTVEIINYKGDRLATTISDSEGRFSFNDIKAGQYWLRTKHSQIIGLEVDLNVAPLGKKVNDRLVIFVLGADPSKSCGGGKVEFARP
ncbi:MAG TPA: carboxypeptidase-like regulatory domain-containing protein [Blastocatellia bacterium]|nr:carboxypeptidase-like regulatory domain-containing protein [Blastocatellia bacterium]